MKPFYAYSIKTVVLKHNIIFKKEKLLSKFTRTIYYSLRAFAFLGEHNLSFNKLTTIIETILVDYWNA